MKRQITAIYGVEPGREGESPLAHVVGFESHIVMAGAFLPLEPVVRDRANAILADWTARGFVPPPMIEVVRWAERDVRQPLDLGGITIGMVEQPDGSIRIVP